MFFQNLSGAYYDTIYLSIDGSIYLFLQVIGHLFFPCSFIVLDAPNMDFLFGLDMIRKHQCIIDLKENVLRVGGGEVSVPFLQERDIPSHILDEERLKQASLGQGLNPESSGENGKRARREVGIKLLPRCVVRPRSSRAAPARALARPQHCVCARSPSSNVVLAREPRRACARLPASPGTSGSQQNTVDPTPRTQISGTPQQNRTQGPLTPALSWLGTPILGCILVRRGNPSNPKKRGETTVEVSLLSIISIGNHKIYNKIKENKDVVAAMHFAQNHPCIDFLVLPASTPAARVGIFLWFGARNGKSPSS
ncbi:hypothetical protein AXF42_Ash014707 [Apostasia shenzhenica]|uniref:Aspartic peptidase DDI1-type domain-containing protein n=1 Tax=Apostasia shenzhenica TaxID=1088818 RepID=A0A2H9ZW39_9ASPA|nr:hypothetical protein AXF42_Ash014707 [Apostasia shenzhenica]